MSSSMRFDDVPSAVLHTERHLEAFVNLLRMFLKSYDPGLRKQIKTDLSDWSGISSVTLC